MIQTKNYFKQRIPAFIDPRGYTPFELEFSETEELINSTFIQKWLNYNPPSTIVKNGNHLMIEENEGFSWWVIGYISNPDDLQVPNWNGGKYIVQYENGEIEVLTYESKNPAVAFCGNQVTLRDGTKCKSIRYEDWKK